MSKFKANEVIALTIPNTIKEYIVIPDSHLNVGLPEILNKLFCYS